MAKEEIEDEEISEGAEYSPKSEFSKPKLVEEAVKNCIEARSQEMKSGYYNYKLDKFGNTTAKIWIPDSRKVYDSRVTALRILLAPEVKVNSGFQTKEKSINKKKKKSYDKNCYEIREQVRDHRGVLVWTKTGEKKIPEKDEVVVIVNKEETLAKEEIGIWNIRSNNYWNNLVFLNDQLFAHLNELIDSLNYFKQRVGY